MWQLHTNPRVSLRAGNRANWQAVRTILPTWFDHLRAVIRFWVTCSLVLHTRNKLVTLWLNSINNRQFHQCSIKGKSSMLSRNRCYGLQPLMTALWSINKNKYHKDPVQCIIINTPSNVWCHLLVHIHVVWFSRWG